MTKLKVLKHTKYTVIQKYLNLATNWLQFRQQKNCNYLLKNEVQLLNFAYKRSLNKPYENEVTLTGQNPPSKSYQPLELLTQLKKGLDF